MFAAVAVGFFSHSLLSLFNVNDPNTALGADESEIYVLVEDGVIQSNAKYLIVSGDKKKAFTTFSNNDPKVDGLDLTGIITGGGTIIVNPNANAVFTLSGKNNGSYTIKGNDNKNIGINGTKFRNNSTSNFTVTAENGKFTFRASNYISYSNNAFRVSTSSNTNNELYLYKYIETKNYVLTLKLDGGKWADGSTADKTKNVVALKQYDIISDVITEKPVKAGYKFAGWEFSGVGKLDGNVFTADVGNATLTAKWIKNVTVTIDPAGGIWPDKSDVVKTESAEQGSTIILDEPIREGYRFKGWTVVSDGVGSIGNNGASFTYTVGATDVTITATWEQYGPFLQQVMVRYENPDGSYTPYTLAYSENKNYNSQFSWSKGESAEFEAASVPAYTVTEDTTTEVTIKRKTFTVTVNSGTGIASVSGPIAGAYYRYGETCTISAVVAEGYEWDSWSDGNTHQTRTLTVTADINLAALATPKKYTLTIDPNSGRWNGTTAVSTLEIYMGDEINISNPTKLDSTFLGWKLEGAGSIQNGIFTPGAGDAKLKASWIVPESQREKLRVLEIQPYITNYTDLKSKVNEWTNNQYNVVITSMSTWQLVGDISDILSQYDMIYVGAIGCASGSNYYSRWTKMQGSTYLYVHTGAEKTFADTNNRLGLFDSVLGLGKDKVTKFRYSGNDISKAKLEEMLEFAAAGYPVVLSSRLLSSGAINTSTVDKSSYIYSFLNAVKNNSDYNKGYFVDNNVDPTRFASQLTRRNFVTTMVSGPVQYYDRTLSENAGLTDDKIYINGAEDGSDKNIDNKDLKFVLKIEGTGSVKVTLLIDANSDGRFNKSTETVDGLEVSVLGGNNKVVSADNMACGYTYTITRELEDYLGGVSWKLVISDKNNSSVSYSYQGLSAIKKKSTDEKQKLYIVQVQSSYSGSYPRQTVAFPTKDEVERVKRSKGEITKNNMSTYFNGIATTMYPGLSTIGGERVANSGMFYYYSQQVEEFEIEFFRIMAADFSKLADPGEDTALLTQNTNLKVVNGRLYCYYDDPDLRGEADMLVFGYSDLYDGITGTSATKLITDFIARGRSVLFTHDVTSFVMRETGSGDIWGYDLTRSFRELLGMDRFGAFKNFGVLANMNFAKDWPINPNSVSITGDINNIVNNSFKFNTGLNSVLVEKGKWEQYKEQWVTVTDYSKTPVPDHTTDDRKFYWTGTEWYEWTTIRAEVENITSIPDSLVEYKVGENFYRWKNADWQWIEWVDGKPAAISDKFDNTYIWTGTSWQKYDAEALFATDEKPSEKATISIDDKIYEWNGTEWTVEKKIEYIYVPTSKEFTNVNTGGLFSHTFRWNGEEHYWEYKDILGRWDVAGDAPAACEFTKDGNTYKWTSRGNYSNIGTWRIKTGNVSDEELSALADTIIASNGKVFIWDGDNHEWLIKGGWVDTDETQDKTYEKVIDGSRYKWENEKWSVGQWTGAETAPDSVLVNGEYTWKSTYWEGNFSDYMESANKPASASFQRNGKEYKWDGNAWVLKESDWYTIGTPNAVVSFHVSDLEEYQWNKTGWQKRSRTSTRNAWSAWGAVDESTLPATLTNAANAYRYTRAKYENSNTSVSVGLVQGLTNAALEGSTLTTTTVTKSNSGQLTEYPYHLPDEMTVAQTHAQYFQLDFEKGAEGEDNNIVVWYSLYNSSSSNYYYNKNDVRNNYYIYNKGNITYSGVGHSTKMSEDETKLFINTMIAAYNAGTGACAPEITNNDKSTGKDGTQYIYIDYDVLNKDGNAEEVKKPVEVGSGIYMVAGADGKPRYYKRVYFTLNNATVVENKLLTVHFYLNRPLVPGTDTSLALKPHSYEVDQDGKIIPAVNDADTLLDTKIFDYVDENGVSYTTTGYSVKSGGLYYVDVPLNDSEYNVPGIGMDSNSTLTLNMQIVLRYGEYPEENVPVIGTTKVVLIKRGIFNLD